MRPTKILSWAFLVRCAETNSGLILLWYYDSYDSPGDRNHIFSSIIATHYQEGTMHAFGHTQLRSQAPNALRSNFSVASRNREVGCTAFPGHTHKLLVLWFMYWPMPGTRSDVLPIPFLSCFRGLFFLSFLLYCYDISKMLQYAKLWVCSLVDAPVHPLPLSSPYIHSFSSIFYLPFCLTYSSTHSSPFSFPVTSINPTPSRRRWCLRSSMRPVQPFPRTFSEGVRSRKCCRHYYCTILQTWYMNKSSYCN